MRIVSFLLVIGCAPTLAETLPVRDAEPRPPAEDPDCADLFEVERSWSVPVRDYGMVRGASAFVDDGASFVHASGSYDATVRTVDVGSGEVLDVALDRERVLLLRNAESDVDVVYADGGFDLVRTSTGELRGRLPRQTLGQWGLGLALDGSTLAVLRCDGGEMADIALFSLDGEEERSLPVPVACTTAHRSPLDVSEASGVAVVVDGERGLVVDLASGASIALAAHEAGPDLPAAVHDVAFSPDGASVATAGSDGVLRVHATDTGALAMEREVRVSLINRNIYAWPDTRSPFAWSEDGRWLARGLADDTIVIERLCDGEIVEVLEVDPDLAGPGGVEGAAPATLHFAPGAMALIATYEGGLQGFIADPRD